MAYGDPTGVNKILVEKYGYEWVNGKAWRPGTAPEPESPTIEVTQGPLPDWITPPPSDAFVTQALETLTNPITGEQFTVPTGGYTVNVSEEIYAPSIESTVPVETPIEEPSPAEPVPLKEKIEQLQASLNELQKKYEETLEKLEQANARIAELEGQQSDSTSDASDTDDTAVEPEETPAAGPQQPAETDEVEAVTPETPGVTAPEPELTPQPSYPEPTGVNKILVEKYGYEWVNGKAWKPGSAPEVVFSQDKYESSTIKLPSISEVRSSVIEVGEQANVTEPFASEAYDIYEAAYPSLTPYWWHAVRGMPHVTYKTDEGYVVLKSAMFQYHDSTEITPLVFVIDEGKNVVSADSLDTVNFESAFAFAEAIVSGVSGKVVAEAGPELADRPFTEWPYGNLWFSHIDETGGLSLKPLLDVKSQFADVGVGDINLDGLDDIVAVHLGSYDGDWRSLRLYTQNDDGSFSKDNDFFKFLDAPAGIEDDHWIDHSVTVADLNGDGYSEIIEGTYQLEAPLFQIHSTVGFVDYHLELAVPRDGSTLGLVDAQTADFDRDGDLDLIFKTEGLGADAVGNGFILYRNEGDLNFVDVTDEWSGNSLYTGNDFGITKLHVVDLNGDGSLDIFTEHFGEVPNSNWSSKNFGALFHLNDGTGHLDWQGDNPDFTVPGHSLKDGVCTYLLGAEQGITDILMVYPDQTVSVVTIDFGAV